MLEELQNTFNHNLKFLQDTFPDIYLKVKNLDEKINNGIYQERYSLEFNDSFDIRDNKTNQLLYGVNTFLHAKQDNTSLINTIRLKGKKLDTKYLYRHIKQIANSINQLDINFKLVKVYKAIFIGVGLGFHIEHLFKQNKFLDIFIIEPNIEIFRLSMFLIDYSMFAKGDYTLFLSVGDNYLEELKEFYYCHPDLNFSIKYSLLFSDYKTILDKIIEFIMKEFFKFNIIDFELLNLKRILELKNQDFKLFNINSLKSNLKNPIFVLSAGPSIDIFINDIKKYQDKIYIFAVNTIAQKLYDNNINIDVLVLIDPLDVTYQRLPKDKEYFKNTILLTVTQVDKRVIELFDKENIFLLPSAEMVGDNFILGSNVGTFALIFATYFNTDIYTIGNDASYVGDKYYANSSFETMEVKESNLLDINQKIKLKGNIDDEVISTRKLSSFKYETEQLLSELDLDINIYNLSRGAYIEGLKPLEKFPVFDDVEKKINIKKVIEYELEEFKEFEANRIAMTLKFILSQAKTKDKKIKTINDILNLRLQIYTLYNSFLEKEQNTLLDLIIRNYMTMADTYINFLVTLEEFNQIDVLDKIKRFWLDGLFELTERIIKVLES